MRTTPISHRSTRPGSSLTIRRTVSSISRRTPSQFTGPSSTTIWRVDPAGGVTAAFTTSVNADTLAIDNNGNFYLGGFANLGGLGIHVIPGPVTPGQHNPAVFVDAGPSQNESMLALTTGKLLVAGGTEVRLFDPAVGGIGSSYFVAPPTPGTTTSTINGLARMPLNQFGVGAAVGVKQVSQTTFSGNGFAFPGTPVSALNTSPFMTEPFITNGFVATTGLTTIASNKNGDLFWYTHNTSALGLPQALYRVRQIPSLTVPGSLEVIASGNQITFSISGKTPGSIVQMGIASGHVILPQFYAPFGCTELDPANPLVLPVFNGFGLFGPPDGSAIPANLVLSQTFTLPPGAPSGFPLTAYGIVLDFGAPNGGFFETNVVFTQLP